MERRRPLEIGIIFAVMSAVFIFGAARPMAAMSVSAFLFLLLFFYPDVISSSENLPRIFLQGIFIVLWWMAVQSFCASLNRDATSCELLKWLAAASAFLLVQSLPRRSILRILMFLVILGILESLYGYFEIWSGHEKVLWRVKEAHRGFVTGTYFNRNHLAGLLELCLGVHLGFLFRAFRQRKLISLVLLILSAFIVFLGWMRTGSRMGIASLMISVLLLLPLLIRQSGKKAWGFVLIVTALMAAAFFKSHPVLIPRWESLMAIQEWDEQRFLVWCDTFRILRDHPLAGIGLGSFKWVYPAYQSARVLMGWAHVHNDYLELAVALGIPAFAILCFSFMNLFVNFFKKLSSLESFTFPIAWGILVSLISFLLHGITDFNFAIFGNVLIFFLLAGIASRLLFTAEEDVYA